MPASCRVVLTAGFRRDLRKLSRRNAALVDRLAGLLAILEADASNFSGRYDVKKLSGVRPGEGQWRIRWGDYRVRYDIIANDVVLYSFSHRREAYR